MPYAPTMMLAVFGMQLLLAFTITSFGVMMAYIKQPDVADKLQALAIEPRTSTPDELAKYIPHEIVKWAQVVKDAGIEPQ